MKVKTTVQQEIEIDIEPEEAFRVLCKSLDMGIVLDDTDYFVYKTPDGENAVYTTINGRDHCVDERGDLFVALRNVAVNIFMNTSFRGDDYIMEYVNKSVDGEE